MSSPHALTTEEIDMVSTHPNFITMVESFLQSDESTQSDQDQSANPELVNYIVKLDTDMKGVFYNTDYLEGAHPVTSMNADAPALQTLQKDLIKAEYTPNQVTSKNCVDELSNQGLHTSMEEFQQFFDNFVTNDCAEYTQLIPLVVENASALRIPQQHLVQTPYTINQSPFTSSNDGLNNQLQQTSMEQFQWTTSNHFLNVIPQMPTTISTPRLEVDSTTSEEDSSPQSRRKVTSKGRRQRTQFSGQMILALEREFQANPFISKFRRAELSMELGVPDQKIKVWFQNRRMKTKKAKPQQKEIPTVRIATEGFGNSTMQACNQFQVLPGSVEQVSDQLWWLPGNGCY